MYIDCQFNKKCNINLNPSIMKKSIFKKAKIKAYKAKKIAIKDMNKVMAQSQKVLDELLSIEPIDLVLDY